MAGLNKFLIFIALNMFLLSQAHALRPDFESVRKFHDQEIDQLLKDYTLEESLTVRAELKRKDGELKDQQVVDIPGLYQKTGEPDERGIESVLNLYERKFVFIKKREIGEKEIELVKSALTERLYLPKETIFTTIDNMPKLDDAVKNIKSDFLFGAYTTLIKGGQFLWILIFSIGFIVALWILAKVWKTKSGSGEAGAGSGASVGGTGFGDNNSKSENKIEANDVGFEKDLNVDSKNSQAFETFNFLTLCQNINDSYAKAPGSTSHILWHHLRDLQIQIQFYETLRIQNQIPSEIKDLTSEIIDKIFSFEKRASANLSRKGSKSLHKETLSTVSVELARLKFIKPNEKIESCFTGIYPIQADHMQDLFHKGYDQHYMVLYKLYKDDFMNYLTTKKDESVLLKINDLLTFDPEADHASDQQYKSFSEFLAKLNLAEEAANKKKSVNSKIIHMILGLSEAELLKIEAMKNNDELRAEIPCFEWINIEDQKNLKDLFSNLSGPELKYLLDFDAKFTSALASMDERAQFRFKERMTKEANMVLNWREFRQKIKKTYSYKRAGGNDPSISKAS